MSVNMLCWKEHIEQADTLYITITFIKIADAYIPSYIAQ